MILVSAAEIKGRIISSCYSVFKFLCTLVLRPYRQHRPTVVTINSARVCVCALACVLYTRAASKVMPPIYFHGNYNRYKEHNNTV